MTLIKTRDPIHDPPGAVPVVPKTLWHESAPQPLRDLQELPDDERGWAVWLSHLSARQDTGSPRFPGGKRALFWGMRDWEDVRPVERWARRLARLAADRDLLSNELACEAAGWLEAAIDAPREVPFALESLAWCRLLPQLARRLPATLWWQIVDRLAAAARGGDDCDARNDPLAEQLLGGELSLMLCATLPEYLPCRRLKGVARRTLEAGLDHLIDDKGLPAASERALLRPLLATWTRCRTIARRNLADASGIPPARRLRAMLLAALRLTRRDRSLALVSTSGVGWDIQLVKAVLRECGDRHVKRAAHAALGGGKSVAERIARRKCPPAVHASESSLAVLRADWRRGSPRLVVDYSRPQVLLEAASGRDVLLSGAWEVSVSRDGELLGQAGPWELVCWISAERADYLEVEAELVDGLLVRRQIVLARRDEFLLMADAVLGPEPGAIDYACSLPLAAGVRFQAAQETHEGWLAAGRQRWPVLPLALPEWRCDARGGALELVENRLELRVRGRGRCLFAPLWIDLASDRLDKPLTWRRLTVAQDREIQPRDVAVGHRVQIGKRQWLVYRSLARKTVRSVLGQQLTAEFLVARFRRSRKAKRVVAVE